jgi:hypothetical protein
MFNAPIFIAQVARPESASWFEPFIIGLIVGMLVILFGKKLYRRM